MICSLPENENERLAALHGLGILDTPAEVAFDNLTQLAADLFETPMALVSLVDRERQWFKSCFGLCAAQMPREGSFCTHVVRDDSVLVVEDAAADPRFADNPLVVGGPCLRFYAGAPVRSEAGFVLGTLCVLDSRPHVFDEAARRRLQLLARQVEQLISLHRRGQLLDRETRNTLRSNARYQAIIQGAAAGIVRINGRGRMLEVNRFALDMLGYRADELVGRNVSMLMPARWGESHDAYLEAYQRTGQARVIGKGREVEALHRDGHAIPVHLAVSEVVYADCADADVEGAQGAARESREFIGILSDLREVHAARAREQHERALLQVLHQGLTDYRALLSGNTLWGFLKQALCELTGSHYGLIGEVVSQNGEPALKLHAITDLSWSDESQRLMERLVRGDMMLTNPHSLLGRVFAGGEVVLSNEVASDPRRSGLPPGHPALTRYLGVPIMDEGAVIGMYAIANARDDYDSSLVSWLEPFTTTCALLINLYRQLNERSERAQLLENLVAERTAELAWLSNQDPLTGLPNRRAMLARIGDRVRAGQAAVYFLAFDGVGDIAGMYGYAIADALGQAVARRLGVFADSLPEGVLGVWNSAEWLLLCSVVDDAAQQDIARQVLALCAHPFEVEGMSLYVHARIGVGQADAGCTAEQLVRRAALALPVPSAAESWQDYSPALESALVRRTELRDALRHAIAGNELFLLFQPKVDPRSGAVMGAEALVRWDSPSLGRVSPAEFIPLAEASGEIEAIGNWVIDRALACLKRWQQQGAVGPAFTLAVNVASVQLMRADFAANLIERVRASGVSPTNLELEVTESGLMQDMKLAMRQLQALSAAGMRVAIDDFGTGYSSLAYLKSLPVSVLKIDKAFIQELHCSPQDQRLTGTVIDMARHFGFTTVAEGVELPEQLLWLLEMGCDLVQGFLYAPPLKESVLLDRVRRGFGREEA